MRANSRDEITVLIPLHLSSSYVPVVSANIERLVDSAHIIVSDPFCRDDALNQLERRHQSPRVTFVGRRDIPSGWVEHYNDLQQRCNTGLFMWLAHDDEIDTSYIDLCRAALAANPSAVGAFGSIESIIEPGTRNVEYPPCPHDVIGAGSRKAIELFLTWRLGIPFRGVFRTSHVPPLRHSNEFDEWADIAWVFEILLRSPLVYEPRGIYRKRFHSTSTHASWRVEQHLQIMEPILANVITRTVPAWRRRRALSLLRKEIAASS